MNEKDRIRLRHMLDAGQDAIFFSTKRQRADLDTDRMLYLSLVKCIEIVGEAANQITEETRAQLDEVPWREIINMRNWLIHAYYDINPDILWKTIYDDIPILVATLDRALS